MANPSQQDLVDTLIADGIHDARLLRAFQEIPRAEFVPLDLIDEAYKDRPPADSARSGHNSPSLVAKMIEALQLLAKVGVINVEVIVGDGTAGLPTHAPFDAILVSAAFPRVPPPLAEQVTLGGRLVQPIGAGGAEEVVLFERSVRDLVRRRTIVTASFVRLYGRHAFPTEPTG